MRDTKFAGYDIPKDSLVFFHLYSALMDPAYWKNPEEFRPERFLDQDGKLDEKKENFIPFSIGIGYKYNCLLLTSSSSGPSGKLCFVIVVFPGFLAGTCHFYNVDSTSIQLQDVASTLKRRCINNICPLGYYIFFQKISFFE